MSQVIEINVKKCSKCGKLKPKTNFNHHRHNYARTECRSCEYQKRKLTTWLRWNKRCEVIRVRCKVSGVKFLLTPTILKQLWADQEGKCALTGFSMVLMGGGAASAYTCSVDRIKDSEGYILGNVRLICFAVNSFRGKMTDTEMFEFVTAMYKRRPR